jgi:hypothetical protein
VEIAMKTNGQKLAIIFIICLISIASNAIAQTNDNAATPSSIAPPVGGECTPSIRDPIAPGDQIDLRGPEVPADQKALGITWSYQWTVKENDAGGQIIIQQTGDERAFSYVVPTENYAKSYYIDLMVTANEATLCINEACMLFPIEKPGECEIKTEQPDQVCISDTQEHKYATVATPGQVNQRWWVFPEDKFPEPSKISYSGHTEYKAGDGDVIGVNWNSVAKKSGFYVVFTGYYAKKAPYAYQGSCQKRIAVVDVPSAEIAIE